ncbi:MAG: hypothetical protein FJ098_07215, partial [Deltaproteobacteria bacterium]|nr:hypothetical protein [Deltaproteobacteria bacterium]
CVHTINAAACDDGNPCTTDSCNPASGCVHETNTAACDDGDPCTTGDHCAGGVCAGSCDDGNPCTTGDACVAGVCTGTDVDCDDGNPCTSDWCHPVWTGGECHSSIMHCDDANPCTVDYCLEGECINELGVDCDDGNPCTDGACDPATAGCVLTPNTAACEDGDPCTAGDHCDAFLCVSGTSPTDCDDSNPCTTDSCDPDTGCHHKDADFVSCDDGDPCTVADQCLDGACAPGAPLFDTAEEVFIPAGAFIGPTDTTYDGKNVVVSDLLTISGHHEFASFTVLGGGVVKHPEGDLLGVNLKVCGPLTLGQGGQIDVSGRGCAGGDPGDPGSWTGWTWSPLGCTPEGGATGGSGGSYGGLGGLGWPDFEPAPATNPVYGDAADPVELGSGGAAAQDPGGAGGGRVDIEAGSVALDGWIFSSGDVDGEGGGGSGGAVRIRVTGGTYPGAGEFTGSGAVVAIGGSSGSPFAGGGGGGRIAILGCSGSAFSGSLYVWYDYGGDPGYRLGAPGSIVWDDGNPCTDDVCDPLTGVCSHLPNTAPCEDGDACTVEGLCVAGACVGVALECDDLNPCTDDVCDPIAGCTAVDNSASCDDGDPCTSGDQCLQGSCAPGTPIVDTAESVLLIGPMVIGPSDTSYDGKHVKMVGDLFMLSGHHLFASLDVDGASITHPQGDLLGVNLEVCGGLVLFGAIDVAEKGCLGGYQPGNALPSGETWSADGCTTVGGSAELSGGSYASLGAGPSPNAVYGLAESPLELGSGGGSPGYSLGGNGGGRVDIVAHDMLLGGTIDARGGGTGGSGGAVRIRLSGALSGSGLIDASGGYDVFGFGGGGGRVAILGDAAAFNGQVVVGSPFDPQGGSFVWDDQNPCTDWSCSPTQGYPYHGCQQLGGNTNPCEDGDPCTENVCDLGVCTTEPVDPVPVTCGVGACKVTTQKTCVDGEWVWGECIPPAPGTETCNGLDNDCDGLVDCDDPDCAGFSACCSQPGTPDWGDVWQQATLVNPMADIHGGIWGAGDRDWLKMNQPNCALGGWVAPSAPAAVFFWKGSPGSNPVPYLQVMADGVSPVDVSSYLLPASSAWYVSVEAVEWAGGAPTFCYDMFLSCN